WGPATRPRRQARPRRRTVALPPEPAQGCRRLDGVPETARRTVLRAGARLRAPAVRRVGGTRRTAGAGWWPAARHRGITGAPRGCRPAAVAAHSRSADARIAFRR